MRNYLKNIAIYAKSDYFKMIKLINKKAIVPDVKVHCSFVTYGEKDYPKCFYDCQYPPLVLFYYGHLSIINRPSLAVVGSRDCSNYAYLQTQKIINRLSHKYVIISGLAKGIDGIAHRSSLQGKGTVGFLGCGIDYIYPNENRALINDMKQNHLIMSEYYGNQSPKQYYFPWRNRLIVAAGNQLLVMAARHQSGTMRSVDEAVLINRELYVLPYGLDDSCGEACIDLVNSGATLLSESVIEMLLEK